MAACLVVGASGAAGAAVTPASPSPLGFAIYTMLVVGFVMTAFPIENRVVYFVGGILLWSTGVVAYRAKKKDNREANHRSG